jgi:hypothetical protein
MSLDGPMILLHSATCFAIEPLTVTKLSELVGYSTIDDDEVRPPEAGQRNSQDVAFGCIDPDFVLVICWNII